MVMTVRIYKDFNKCTFETVGSMPHEIGKYIVGFAKDIEEAKRRVILYAGANVEFIDNG